MKKKSKAGRISKFANTTSESNHLWQRTELDEVKIAEQKIPQTRVKTTFRLDPFESKLIKIPVSDPINSIYKTETNNKYRAKNIEVLNGIVSTKRGYVTVCICNKSLEPVIISEKAKVCNLIPIHKQSEELMTFNMKKSRPETEYRISRFANTENQNVKNSNNGMIEIKSQFSEENASTIEYSEQFKGDKEPIDDKEEYYRRFNTNQDLKPEENEILKELLIEKRDCFVFKGDPVGKITVVTHAIDTGDAKPISKSPYRLSVKERQIVEQQVQEMLDKGIIVPSNSCWASPIVLVNKRDGTIRFCVDYRALNAVSKSDVYPLPRLDDGLDCMAGSDVFSVMDASQMFWQIAVEPESQEKTTFVCHLGTYMFQVMPFGLKNSPATAMRAMNTILQSQNRKTCFVYLDDVICYSKGFPEHISRLRTLFELMIKYGLKLKPSKCFFCMESVSYLGHLVSKEGIRPDPERTAAIFTVRDPKNVKGCRSFLGFMSFYRRFIRDFSRIAYPITKLLKRNEPFVWGEEQRKAKEELLQFLKEPPILVHYDPEAELELRTDASGFGISGHLVQIKDEKSQLLGCVSRTLTDAETRYPITEMECLAIVWSVMKFRPYLFGKLFTIKTDHCGLCYLMKVKDVNGRLARWSLRMQTHEFKIIYNSGKEHLDADCLSRHPMPLKSGDEKITDFPVLKFNSYGLESNYNTEFRVDSKENAQRIAALQREDKSFKKCIEVLENPELSNSKKRRLAKNYILFDSVLYKGEWMDDQFKYRLCVPKPEILKVLKFAHDSETACHLGTWKTYMRIRPKFYWKNMEEDVRHYVKSCEACQKRKVSPHMNQGLQQPIPMADEVLDSWNIDLVGPLPETKSGNKYIVTINDQLSKFAIAVPIPQAKDRIIMDVLIEKVILIFGPPKILLSDQGSNLTSDYCHHIYRRFGIEHRRTSGYHPRTNGQNECLNKVIGVALAIMASRRKEWDKWVPYVMYAYNTSKHHSSKQSPYRLLYGKEPRLDIEERLGFTKLIDGKNETRDKVLENLIKIRETAKENIKKIQEINKQYVDKRRVNVVFKPGDLVLVYMSSLKMSKGGKLKNRYVGPLKVLQRMSPVNYKCITTTGELRVGIFHAERLKRFYTRKPEFIDDQDLEVVEEKTPSETSMDTENEEKDIRDEENENTINKSQSHERNNSQNDSSEETEIYFKDQTQSNDYLRRSARRRRPPNRYGTWDYDSGVNVPDEDIGFSEGGNEAVLRRKAQQKSETSDSF